MENIKEPSQHITAVLDIVKSDYLVKTYPVTSWNDTEDFLEQIAKRMGRLLKVRVHKSDYLIVMTLSYSCRVESLMLTQ